MIERTLKRQFHNTSTDRVVVTIKSSQCAPKSVESRFAIAEVLQAFVTTPELLNCDTEFFEKATVAHDGRQWIVVAEALVPKPVLP